MANNGLVAMAAAALILSGTVSPAMASSSTMEISKVCDALRGNLTACMCGKLDCEENP